MPEKKRSEINMTAFNLPIPAASSLESYITTVNGIPLLTPERELELGKQLKYDNNLNAAGELVLSHLRVVVSIARNYMGYGLPQADLIQEGNIGLMKAVKRFDPDRGVRLVSFAVHWIRAEIHEFILKNWKVVKVATTKAQRKLFFNLRSMKTGTNTLTTTEVAQMAKTLGVKPEEVREMETRMQGIDMPLDAGPDDSEDWVSPIAYLSDPDAEPSKQLEVEQLAKNGAHDLETALNTLDDRSRRIIEARWLGNEKESATLHDLADEFGVSAERIRQIEAKAMQKMRGLIGR